MKKLLPVIITAALAGTILWACKDPNVDPGTKTDPELTDDCRWIYDQLCESYYWNDAVKKATPKANLPYDEFLEDLLSKLSGAKDITENPATIDGGYYDDGSRYIYSYVDRTSASRSSESVEMTFGFGFEAFFRDKAKGLYCFLITWVQPDGPAEKAGLKRGAWIYQYNGRDITYDDYEDFFYQVYRLEGGDSMTLTDKDGTTKYSLTAAMTSINPIIFKGMVTSPGGNEAAYLVYNAFETGEDGEFDADLRNAFAEFKKAGAKELILDLRYNHGGYVSCCQILTSLAANVSTGQTFAKLQYNSSVNKNNPEVIRFRNEPNSLKRNKIYVLATKASASASEMVISSLRGVNIDVVHIGAQTEGKNVGMDLKSKVIDGYSYEMWPITFKIKNAKDFCDYAGGFKPIYDIDEFKYRNTVGVFELGDPEEELLKQALIHIDGGTPSQKASRAGNEDIDMIDNPLKTNRGGAKVVRNEAGEVQL